MKLAILGLPLLLSLAIVSGRTQAGLLPTVFEEETSSETSMSTPTPWCDPYEPNNSPAQAWGPLATGQSYQAKLCVGDSDDWYYFTVQTLNTITIDLIVPSTVDYDLFLYDPSMTLVAYSNSNGKGVSEHIIYVPPSIGKYYVRVYADPDRDDVNFYTLVVTFTPSLTATPTPRPTNTPTPTRVARVYLPVIMKGWLIWVPNTPTPTPIATPTATPTPWCDPYEPNDGPAQAWGPLLSGQSYQAKLCVGDPDDWYHFTIQTLSTITVALTVPSTVDYDLFLYDASLTLVTYSNSNGKGVSEHIIYIPPSIGKYYVRVYPYEGWDNANFYTLVVTFTPSLTATPTPTPTNTPTPTPTPAIVPWRSGGPPTTALIQALAIAPQCLVYAGTGGDQGVYKSSNGCALPMPTWFAPMNRGLVNKDVPSLAVNGTPTVYAATWGSGVYKTINGGDDWVEKNNGLGNPHLYAIVIDTNAPMSLYVGTDGSGVYKTNNGGELWEDMNDGLLTDRNVRSLAIDPVAHNVLYAGLFSSGIWKYQDGSWRPINGNGGPATSAVRAIVIDPQNNQRIFAGTSTGVYRTINGGNNWISTLATEYVYSLVMDPQNGDILYAATRDHAVWQTTDGGVSWNQIGPPGVSRVRSLAIGPDPASGRSVLHAGTNNGVWEYGP